MDILDRLVSSVVITKNNCWEWTKSTDRDNGYGRLTIGSRKNGTRKNAKAHRVSFETFVGKIPRGMWVLHTCDNPTCINPEHLYLGTRKENTRDMVERKRYKVTLGEESPIAVMTDKKVLAMRKERHEKGTPYRKLASKYGLKSHKSARQICNGTQWAHVPSPPEDADDS